MRTLPRVNHVGIHDVDGSPSSSTNFFRPLPPKRIVVPSAAPLPGQQTSRTPACASSSPFVSHPPMSDPQSGEYSRLSQKDDDEDADIEDGQGSDKDCLALRILGLTWDDQEGRLGLIGEKKSPCRRKIRRSRSWTAEHSSTSRVSDISHGQDGIRGHTRRGRSNCCCCCWRGGRYEESARARRARKNRELTEMLPEWAASQDVWAHAKAEQKKGLAVQMRRACGPTITWMLLAWWLTVQMDITLFFLALKTSECDDSGNGFAVYPMWIWAIVVPFTIPLLYIEVVCLRYSIIPFTQAVNRFRMMNVDMSYNMFLACGLTLSCLSAMDGAADGFAAASTLVSLHKCHAGSRLETVWMHVIHQSAISGLLPVQFLSFTSVIWVLWMCTQLEMLFVLVNLPRPSELPAFLQITGLPMDDPQSQDGESPNKVQREWTSIRGNSSFTSGDFLYQFAEVTGMATISMQTPAYPKAKAMDEQAAETKELIPRARKCVEYVCSALERATHRFMWGVLLENVAQLNIQVTNLAMSFYIAKRMEVTVGIVRMLQIHVSLFLGTLMCAWKVKEGWEFIKFQWLVEDWIRSNRECLDDTEVKRKYDKMRWQTYQLYALVALTLGFTLMAFVKYCAAYYCKDSLWNITGCADLEELRFTSFAVLQSA